MLRHSLPLLQKICIFSMLMSFAFYAQAQSDSDSINWQENTSIVTPSDSGSLFDKFKSLFGSNKPVIETLVDKDYKPSTQAIGLENDFWEKQAAGYGLIRSEALQTYANRILERLKQASGINNVPGQVYLLATDSLDAIASADGNIYISYKWFDNISRFGTDEDGDTPKGKEDTLAALLAHELAHVILSHHNSDLFSVAQKKAQQLFGNIVGLKAVLTNGMNNTLVKIPESELRDLQKMQVMIALTDKMLAPAWKRGQEEEADALGADLTQRAGYNYATGMRRLLLVNKAWDEKNQEKKAKRTAAMQSEIDQLMRSGKSDAAIKKAMEEVGKQLLQTLGATHPDAAGRLGKLDSYVEKHYPEEWIEQRPAHSAAFDKVISPKTANLFKSYDDAFAIDHLLPHDTKAAVKRGAAMVSRAGVTNDNWLIHYQYYYALLLDGRSKEAEAVLKKLVANRSIQSMSFKPYEDHIKLSLHTGNTKKAIEMLSFSEGRFRRAQSVLPSTISLYAQAKNTQKVNDLVTYCVNTYTQIREECNKAAKIQ